MTARPWIEAAAALRHAALMTPGVSDLTPSAAFQTHGPGRAVRGVALEATPGGAHVSLGVVVALEGREAGAAEGAALAGVARRVRSAALAAWERTRVVDSDGRPVALEVSVHVTDVAQPV